MPARAARRWPVGLNREIREKRADLVRAESRNRTTVEGGAEAAEERERKAGHRFSKKWTMLS